MNNLFFKKSNKKGYTLTEIMTVIVILGVVISFAYPKYEIVMEKFRAQEGVNMLLSIYRSQKDRLKDRGKYLEGFSDVTLDITVPSMRYFSSPEFGCGTTIANCTGGPDSITCSFSGIPQGFLATVDRTSTTYIYSLFVFEDGRVVCSACPQDDSGGICQKLGFPNF